jgi:hypothetical protein
MPSHVSFLFSNYRQLYENKRRGCSLDMFGYMSFKILEVYEQFIFLISGQFKHHLWPYL